MQIQFGAQATAGQTVAAQELAKKLYDEETVSNNRPDLVFFRHVTGLRDFRNTIDEVRADGETLNDNLYSLAESGQLPREGNVDVLYFWHFPSANLARLGAGAVRFFTTKRKATNPEASLVETNTVRRDGDKVLLRTRINAKALSTENV